MTQRNPLFKQLKESYLFPEILKRKRLYLEKHPEASLISLGIGDTTQPLPPLVAEALSSTGFKLSTPKGYRGYGPEQGDEVLRIRICEKIYNRNIHPNEIFISDGTKCDIGRLQLLFGNSVSIAVQDPTFPVYVEGSLLHGVEKIHLLPCLPETDFFPQLAHCPRSDLIYFCSPNNPTGIASTREQLKQLVAFAKANHSIILFDAAYSFYIDDPSLPKSIYEIEGAQEVAIEMNSFSKSAGFTGVRLGWTVVPKALRYTSGEQVHPDWTRLTQTIFNGASCISQQGGVAVLSENGWAACMEKIALYKENAKILREAFRSLGKVYGGDQAPFLWVHVPEKKSWQLFQELLEKAHLVTTPGVGFGAAGEGFIRLTAFCSREDALKAGENLKAYLKSETVLLP